MRTFDFRNIYLFSWGDLYYIQLEYEVGLDAFRRLNSNQETSLKQTKDEFDRTVESDETLNSLDDQEQGAYYSQIFEREERMIVELQRQQRHAIILSIFSFYEGRLKSICNLIENEYNFKIKVKDLGNGEDLMRYWNYLEKVFEIDPVTVNPHFTPIRQQKIVRNIIAHQDGIVNADQVRKINVVRGLAIKQDWGDYQIDIYEVSYIEYLLDKMGTFFKELLLTIDKRYKEKKLD